ncbi:MAG: DUF1232 domain-containing protein [Stigonema ocellatum SAG 48.90 = DSM 106950]|nr:DUF1232 domain-containing protein [Stigonema ocellatum SAG 48.90 = DSM 106950]
MKLARIRKRVHGNLENQGLAKQIKQHIEQKNDSSVDTINHDSSINKTSHVDAKQIGSQIQYLVQTESIPFWQMYFLKLAVKSGSYSFMKYVFFQLGCYSILPRNQQLNRTGKILQFALNTRNWKRRINKIRSKYQAFVKRSREPESAWTSLAVILGVCIYLISPEDFISEFIPIIGFIDDLILIIFFTILLAFELKNNIIKLNESEVRKYIFILKLIFSFGIAGVVSLVSAKLLMQIGVFLYT